ncbi:MAG TPA: hypothetical protein VFP48_03175 [Steroidobacteraceae bacterium]|nr:hypothetical protein [Steroidobacteraceae bacterium]
MPMLSTSRDTRRGAMTARFATACLLLLLLAACTDRRQEPAERAIAEVEAALDAAGTAPAKYIPGELEDVRSRLAALKQDFEREDYGAVLDAAPDVLAAARALASTAAAREAELHQALRVEWAALAQSVPAELAAVAERFDRAATGPKRPAGVTAAQLGAAKSRLRDALALWDRARQEATAGRLPEAVTLAHQVRDLGRAVDAVSQAGAADAPVK